jgi:hypothetical protein
LCLPIVRKSLIFIIIRIDAIQIAYSVLLAQNPMAKQTLKNPSRAGELPKAKAPNAPEMASKTFSVLRNFWVKQN